jgi:hypothetical protein
MKRNPSESGTKNLADELAELRGLDPLRPQAALAGALSHRSPGSHGARSFASSRGLPATGEGFGWS